MHVVRPTVSAPAAPSTTGATHVKIHTPALLQILEIVAKQALEENKRIIGTLLGIRSDDGSEVEIRDAFMVPCDETGDSVSIEEHTHKTMYQLYKKAHPKELVLGWFGSSLKIDATTSLIHDFYSKGVDRAYPFPAIYLNVEYLKDGQVVPPTVSTYVGAAVGKPTTNNPAGIPGWKTVNSNNSYIFTPLPNQVISSTVSEKLAVDSLKENSINQDSYTLQEDLSHLNKQLQYVVDNVDKLISYIDDRASAGTASDDDLDLLRLLSNTLLNKPHILTDMDELAKLFTAHNQDVIMIEYLTKVVKEQIEWSARLTASSDVDKRH